ncbi:AMSH-like protease [Bagarius yarrelli]|uniref:AMSH-like protease n=1 Tax=Bagarius yarrelli TaxID=175774 RepID=A0A556TIS5_BAGYA|nr:AMSH-like protease [Bagarius yarrelli]
MEISRGSEPARLHLKYTMEEEFSFSSLEKLAAEPDYTDVTLPAVERVRALSKMGYNIEISEDIAPRRYFRSGVEMERMAAVYLEEGSLENAFVLYNKFITLFVEKLPSHRDYQQCNVPEKQVIMKKLQEVAFPRKDQLKKLLHEKYSKEYCEYKKSQSQPVPVAVCREQLQRLSLLEEEKQRVAQLKKMQLESEQFRFFEEQLLRQEQANRKPDACSKEQTDGSCLSQTPKYNTHLDPNRNKQATPLPKPAATLAAVQNQQVEGLRRVLIPRDLTYRFLMLADRNTARGIETCGVLCGKLTHNEFVLTHVIVPKQSSGPDYCDMENVEELFSYQDHHNLLTLGWIHLMLPEAIAIVCSPKHNDTGVFRLTSAGMSEVAGCRLKGFHPHRKDPPLFTVRPSATLFRIEGFCGLIN